MKKKHLKKLLKELKQGEVSEETKGKAKSFLQTLDATTLGLVEQELIRESVSRDEIRKNLCDIHLELLKDTLVSKKIEVSAPHPVHTFMEEHKVILNMKFVSAVKAFNELFERPEFFEFFV